MFGIKKKRRVFIVSACRTPIGNFGGMLKNYSAIDLGAAVLRGAVQKFESDPRGYNFMDCNIFMGNVLSAGLGQNPARQAAHKAGFPWGSSCVTINKVCGSGMQAIISAYDAIKSGRIDWAFAGGMESMTNAPYLIARPLEITPKGNLKPKIGDSVIDLGKDVLYVDSIMRDGLADAYSYEKMAKIADKCAKRFGISREMQDEYAVKSNERAIYAIRNGLFKDEIVAVGDLSEDEGIKQFKPEKMPELKPIFEGGSITAANASKISDGAAALMIVSEEIVGKFVTKPLAEIVDIVEYSGLPEDFPTAPSRAMGRLFEQNGLEGRDIGSLEINEAFAVVPIIVVETFGISFAQVNVRGGAVALGHPIGASGARIVVTLVHDLQSNELGIASVCIGGGEALAILVKKI